ncbi:MAG: hypothetical protein JO327_00330 [Nitrososphaeraceae archaeon]|nr:hypothetical protein [Nitrososphaeraceae archaeon]MBV9666553.1 hypothetical protein [Nitrososphaeraceae archaeon]
MTVDNDGPDIARLAEQASGRRGFEVSAFTDQPMALENFRSKKSEQL